MQKLSYMTALDYARLSALQVIKTIEASKKSPSSRRSLQTGLLLEAAIALVELHINKAGRDPLAVDALEALEAARDRNQQKVKEGALPHWTS